MDCTGSKFDLFDPPIGLRERERIEMLANVYSIIAATDYLERAFARDSVNSAEYAKECAALISKFKTFSKVLGPSFNAKEFAESYGLHAPVAISRLVDSGIPATEEHENRLRSGSSTVKLVAELAQLFVTIIDMVKLEQLSSDLLHPVLSELVVNLRKIEDSITLSEESKSRLKEWLITLNKMNASDRLDETQSRQLLFDLESANSEFYRALS